MSAKGTVRPSAKPMIVSRMTGPRLMVPGCFAVGPKEKAVLAGLGSSLVLHLIDAFRVVLEELVSRVMSEGPSCSAMSPGNILIKDRWHTQQIEYLAREYESVIREY